MSALSRFFSRLTYPLTRWLAHNRLDRLYSETAAAPERVIRFGSQDKFIFFSDCHRGDSSWKDDYAPNRNLHLYALTQYLREGFTYIELGDGDELFENSDFGAIAYAHRDVFYRMRNFYCDVDGDECTQKTPSRLHLIFGNHDIQRRNPDVVKKQLHQFFIEYKGEAEDMFPEIAVHEGLILEYSGDGERKRMFLVHGHQGDWFNDYLWPVALVFVRFVWAPLQQFIGWRDPTLPPKPYQVDKWGVRQRISEWAARKNQIVVCGHTHRSHFSDPDEEALYFNTGSCVHPRCITGIEIENGAITLVKWEQAPRAADGVLTITRKVLKGPTPLRAYARAR